MNTAKIIHNIDDNLYIELCKDIDQVHPIFSIYEGNTIKSRLRIFEAKYESNNRLSDDLLKKIDRWVRQKDIDEFDSNFEMIKNDWVLLNNNNEFFYPLNRMIPEYFEILGESSNKSRFDKIDDSELNDDELSIKYPGIILGVNYIDHKINDNLIARIYRDDCDYPRCHIFGNNNHIIVPLFSSTIITKNKSEDKQIEEIINWIKSDSNWCTLKIHWYEMGNIMSHFDADASIPNYSIGDVQPWIEKLY